MEPTEITYSLPEGVHSLEHVYAVEPGEEFSKIWRDTDPDQSDRLRLRNGTISDIKIALRRVEDLDLEVPSLNMDICQGVPEISFIDGRHRFTALSDYSVPLIPVYVPGGLSPEAMNALGCVRALPDDLKAHIKSDEGLCRDADKERQAAEELREYAQKNREAFIEHYKRKGQGRIAEQIVDYIATHGVYPPEEEMDRWHQEAQQKAAESDKPSYDHLPDWQRRILEREPPKPRLPPQPGESEPGMGGRW